MDGFVFSSFGMGLDGLLNFYKLSNDTEEQNIVGAFRKHYPNQGILPQSYISRCSGKLDKALSAGMFKGITASCSADLCRRAGFFDMNWQGRILFRP